MSDRRVTTQQTTSAGTETFCAIETERPVSDRLIAGGFAWLVLFYSLMLAYCPVDPLIISETDWPRNIPKNATQYRGWPFVDGYERSSTQRRGEWVGQHTQTAGLAANLTIAFLIATATFVVFNRLIHFRFQVALNSALSLVASVAIALAILTNQHAIDFQLAPALGLLRSKLPSELVAASFHGLGQGCLCAWIGFSLMQGISQMSRLGWKP